MYVKNLQISDTAKINSYLRFHNVVSNFVYAPLQIISDTLLTIEFGINDSANFKPRNTPAFYTAQKISYPDNLFLIKRYDSIMDILSSRPDLSRCDTLNDLAVKRFPLGYYITYGGAGMVIRVSFGGFPIRFQNGELSLHLITYFLNTSWNYSNSSGKCSIFGLDRFAVTTQNIESNLSSMDTIVVQEKKITLSKM